MKFIWPLWLAAGLPQQQDIASIRVRDAALGYIRQLPVQSQLSVEFKRGALHAVIGENGSGKTCLLKTLAGIHAPQQGSISLTHAQGDNTGLSAHNVSQVPFEHRALWQGYVEQKARIHWNLSVEQVVRLGASARRDMSEMEQEKAALSAMASCGCDEFADRPVLELSAGEQQRVMLARVIAAKPKVLLVDEPTAGLDPRYQNTIMQLLHQQAVNGTVVIAVMHDIELVRRYCDNVLVLEKRRKIAPGAGLHSQEQCRKNAPGAGLRAQGVQENCTGSDPARFGAVDEVLTPGLLKRVFGIG